jgi:N-acetylneuraminic acid mutarotase
MRWGGNDGSTILLTRVEAYDVALGSWAPRAAIPTARERLGLAAAANGKLYAVGGYNGSSVVNTVEEYDPTIDTWTTRRPCRLPARGWH